MVMSKSVRGQSLDRSMATEGVNRQCCASSDPVNCVHPADIGAYVLVACLRDRLATSAILVQHVRASRFGEHCRALRPVFVPRSLESSFRRKESPYQSVLARSVSLCCRRRPNWPASRRASRQVHTEYEVDWPRHAKLIDEGASPRTRKGPSDAQHCVHRLVCGTSTCPLESCPVPD